MSPRAALPVLATDPAAPAARELFARVGRGETTAGEEWVRVLAEDGFGPLPAPARGMAEDVARAAERMLAGGFEDDDAGHLVSRAAARGEALRASGLSSGALLRLHFLLREALWRVVQRETDPRADPQAVMAWLDPPLTLAASVALSAPEPDPQAARAAAAASALA